jgi:hypothetical protein
VRKKLIALSIALAAAGFALATPQPSQALHCNGFLVCCDNGTCYCCSRPCPIQCP